MARARQRWINGATLLGAMIALLSRYGAWPESHATVTRVVYVRAESLIDTTSWSASSQRTPE